MSRRWPRATRGGSPAGQRTRSWAARSAAPASGGCSGADLTLQVLRDAFETCGRTGWHISYEEFKGALALGLAGTGRLDEALVALDDAMAADREGADGRGWYAPELLRIKGEVLLQQAAHQSTLAAEECFNQAAQLAREQGALFWELRVALSVARLRVSQGRHHEARAQLASVYDRFTEGFATADLQ